MAISDADITHSGGSTTNSLSGRLNFEQDQNRIIGRDSNNIPRLLILGDNNDFVMKISKVEEDVLTASNEELIFNSNQNVFKIVKSDTITTPTYLINGTAGQWNTSTTDPLVINHGLGYKPIVWAFTISPFSGFYIPLPTSITSTPSTSSYMSQEISASVSSLAVVFSQQTITNGSVTSVAGGSVIHYYLLQETVQA